MIAQFSILALDGLLAATLIYLFVLMRKLKSFQSYRNEMRTIVNDVISSTDSARDAISRLKASVVDSQSALAQHIEAARQIETRLANQLIDARNIISDLQVTRLNSVSELAQFGHSKTAADKERTLHADGARMAPLVEEELARLKSTVERSAAKSNSLPDHPNRNERIASLHDAVKSLRNRVAISS